MHQVLGKRFFEWVAAEKSHWSFLRIRKEFSQRVVALAEDLLPLLVRRMGEVKTIVIGGGNSDYVSVRLLQNQTGCEVQSFRSRTLRIDPDFVPLIGLHKIVFGEDLHVES